jgi:hypothetical protein
MLVKAYWGLPEITPFHNNTSSMVLVAAGLGMIAITSKKKKKKKKKIKNKKKTRIHEFIWMVTKLDPKPYPPGRSKTRFWGKQLSLKNK